MLMLHRPPPAPEPTDPRVPTAAALEQAARRDGFKPGFPPLLGKLARHVDLGVCRRLSCPACKSRGMGGKPYHKPGPGLKGGGYRMVAVCPKCGAGERV